MGRYLLGTVDAESFKWFHKAFHGSTGVFTLFITSEGGDTDYMWALVDLILCSNRPVHGVASGICYSAAPLILAACDVRVCAPNTQFMVHEDVVEVSGTPGKATKEAERAKAEELRWYTAMSVATNTSIDTWRYMSEKETFFDSKEALRLGLVHRILPVLSGKKKKS